MDEFDLLPLAERIATCRARAAELLKLATAATTIEVAADLRCFSLTYAPDGSDSPCQQTQKLQSGAVTRRIFRRRVGSQCGPVRGRS